MTSPTPAERHMAATITTTAETEARELAASILAGETQPYGDGIYTAKQWAAAAQYLTDSDDCEELIYMMEQEDAAQPKCWTQADYDNDDTFWRDSTFAAYAGLGARA